MEQALTLIATTVVVFLVTKLCSFVWDKLTGKDKEKRK